MKKFSFLQGENTGRHGQYYPLQTGSWSRPGTLTPSKPCMYMCMCMCMCVYSPAPCAKTLVTLRCKLRSRSGLALGPLGAPEYEFRVNSRSRVPLPIFFLQI